MKLGYRRSTRRDALREGRLAVPLVASLAASVLLTVPQIAVADPTPTADATTSPTISADLNDASTTAQSTGQPVEVQDRTTETSQVTAEPDGTFRLTSSLTPVRVNQDGAWRPIDPTLHRDADGSISPAATTADVTFSGGGDQPAVVISEEGATVSFSWPAPLPAPALSGATATYASVLPGVDLQLTATDESFSEVLVVKTAAAAANPQLRSIHLEATSQGLELTRNPDGSLSALDADGNLVLHGSQPMMWDSSANASVGARPTSTDPGSGTVSLLPDSMPSADGTTAGPAGTTLTLTPPASALTGPNVIYPLYIDPELAPYRSHFAVVTSDNNWHYYDDTSNDLKVGYCNWSECGGSWKARTYLSFNTSALTGEPTTAVVSKAEVDVYEIHSAGDCTSEPVDLYTAGAIDSSTDWPGPMGSYLDETSSHLGNTCNNTAGDVVFNAAAVTDRFQYAASHDVTSLTFGLRSPDESNAYQWKRFDSDRTGGAAAQIDVFYDFPPSTPSVPTLDNTVKCSGLPTYTRDTTPTLHSHATDYNSPHLPVSLHYSVYNSGGSRVRYNPSGVVVSSGADAPWSTSSSNSNDTAAMSNGNYTADAVATSHSDDTADAASGTSSKVAFTIDTTAPAVPTISSFDYPPQTWGDVNGGQITLTGSSDTAGFAYSFDSSGTEPLPADTTCSYTTTPTAAGGRVAASAGGAATITLPTLTPGYHTLYVKAFDDAHNAASQTPAYVFYVAPNVSGEGTTQFESEDYTAAPSGMSCQDTGCPSYIEGPSTRWSNGKQLHLVADQGSAGAPATWQSTFTTGVEADYAINVQVTLANHYGILEFRFDDTLLAAPGGKTDFDTYSASVSTQNIALGGLHLTAGTHTITYQLVGTNPASASYTYSGNYGTPAVAINFADNGYSAGIDYVRLIPINGAVYGSLNGAMNNDGITSDTGAAGNISPSTTYRSFSQTALTNAGYGPGSTVTVDSGTQYAATFTMPSYNSNGTDNVIAMGQTIPLPTPVKAQYVDLLVASSCGDTPYAPSVQVSVNFADLTYSQTQTPAVPDFLTGTISNAPDQEAYISLATTLTYSRKGTTTVTDQPNLYHVAIPTFNDQSAVTSITLPYLGSDLSNTCRSSNLHVFAITTH